MAGLLESFDTKTNFWDIAGNLSLVKEFSELKEADRTKNKEYSSKVMWAVAILLDQSEANKLRNLPMDDKKKIIDEEILKAGKRFEWEKRQHLIDAYHRVQLTVNERALYDTEYTVDNAKDLDSIITNSEKLFKTITVLEKLIEADKRAGGEIKGGRKKGLAERGGF